jgi:hypothetical protein
MKKKNRTDARNLTLPIDFDQGRLSELPLPEWVVDRLGGAMAHIDPHDGNLRLYAVRDWVYWISGSKSKQIGVAWSKLKNKLILENVDKKDFPFWKSLSIETSGGPQMIDFADAEGLYEIAARISDRSATARIVKHYLAKCGVIVDAQRLEQLQADNVGILLSSPNSLRQQAIERESISRKHMMDALTAAVYFIILGWEYIEAADTVLWALYNRRDKNLRAELGLKSIDRLQDHMPVAAVNYLSIAQDMIALDLADRAELSWDEARDYIYKAASVIGRQVEETGRLFKVDIATGRRLLADQVP